jgi:hypothetical protein
MLIIFFDIKWSIHKEFILEVQTVNSVYYCDVLWWLHDNVKTLPRTLATRELAAASQQRIVSLFIFHQEIFFIKSHMCCLPSSLLSSIFLIKDKT